MIVEIFVKSKQNKLPSSDLSSPCSYDLSILCLQMDVSHQERFKNNWSKEEVCSGILPCQEPDYGHQLKLNHFNCQRVVEPIYSLFPREEKL